MLRGFRGYVNGVYVIRVDGFPRVRFFDYSRREAERNYRRAHGLEHRRIDWSRGGLW